jgi:hypothetical protein
MLPLTSAGKPGECYPFLGRYGRGGSSPWWIELPDGGIALRGSGWWREARLQEAGEIPRRAPELSFWNFDADDFAHGMGVEAAVGEGEGGEGPCFGAGAEVVDGDEGGFVEGIGLGVDDVGGAGDDGAVEVAADADGAGGGDVTPAGAGVAFVADGEALGIKGCVVGVAFTPEELIVVAAFFAGEELGGEFEVFDGTGFDVDAAEVVKVMGEEPVPVVDGDVGLVGIGMAFAGFDGGVGFGGPGVFVRVVCAEGGVGVEGLFAEEGAGVGVEDKVVSFLEAEGVAVVPVAGEGGVVSGELGAPEGGAFLAGGEAGEAVAVGFFEGAVAAAAGVGDGELTSGGAADDGGVVDGGADLFTPEHFAGVFVEAVDVGPDLFGIDIVGDAGGFGLDARGGPFLDFCAGFFVGDFDVDEGVVDEEGFGLAVVVFEAWGPFAEPDFITFHVVAADGAAAVEEPDVFAVGDGGEDGAVGEAAGEGDEGGAGESDLPEDFSGIGVEAEADDIGDVFFFFEGLYGDVSGGEEAVIPNGDGAHAGLGHGGAPADVFVAGNAPVGGGLAFDLPVVVGAGGLGPVCGGGGVGFAGDEGGSDEREGEGNEEADCHGICGVDWKPKDTLYPPHPSPFFRLRRTILSWLRIMQERYSAGEFPREREWGGGTHQCR